LDKADLTEAHVSGEEVWSGNLLHVQRHVVRLPDGSLATREFIRHPGAVLILPLFDDGRVLLERQFRYPHRREFIELPAGKMDPGEAPLQTAQRELLEETGYAATDWKRLGVIHTSVAYTDEAIEMFAARGLDKREQKLDPGEFLECFALPLAEAIAMVGDGRITDAKTVAALLWVGRFGA
jgi:ADP-ribose pyrophosphatase